LVSIQSFHALSLSYTEATEAPHFEKTSFRIREKIFATLVEKGNKACLKLSEKDQDIFSISAPNVINPVPNK